ncbi:MAG: hypothetical protein WCP98_19990 [Actinomycetes bacterium]
MRHALKRYGSEKAREAGYGRRHLSVTPSPLNPDDEPIDIAVDDEADVTVVAEVVEILA